MLRVYLLHFILFQQIGHEDEDEFYLQLNSGKKTGKPLVIDACTWHSTGHFVMRCHITASGPNQTNIMLELVAVCNIV